MILVTGGTGFIGRAVVARLVAAGRDVAVLARRRDARDARARVAAALGDEAAGVRVVEGELAADGAGLAPGERRWLRGRVETVVHCAGDTSFAPRLSAPYVGAHVDGPVALLRALAGGRLARWVHMSTAYVCGTRQGTIHEDEGDRGQTFHNAYERVKLQAEGAVRAAGAAVGIDVRVLRPSVVVGAAPATAGGTPSNLFFAFIRLLAALARWRADVPLRLEGAPHARFNIVPLDYVTAATVALAGCPEGAAGTFHLPPTLMHVSRGLSGKTPVRYNCPPELTKLLRKASIPPRSSAGCPGCSIPTAPTSGRTFASTTPRRRPCSPASACRCLR